MEQKFLLKLLLALLKEHFDYWEYNDMTLKEAKEKLQKEIDE